MTPTSPRAYLAWATVCLVWGTTYLAIRIALETIPPLLLTSLRWLAAGAVLIVALKIRRERLPATNARGRLALLGLLMIGLGNGGVVWAEQTVPSGLTSVLVAALPFWMTGIERLMPIHESMTVRQALGMGVGFGGIVLLVWPEIRLGEGRGFLTGVAASQLACVAWAIGSSYSRRQDHEESLLATVAFEMFFAGLVLLAAGLVRGEWATLRFSDRTLGALAYLTAAGSIVAYSAYAYALKHMPVATLSLYAYVNPVIAVLLGTLVFGEPFGARIAIAAGIVFAGMILVR